MARKDVDVDRKRRKLTAAYAGTGAAAGATGAVLGTKAGNAARRLADSVPRTTASGAGRVVRAPQSAKGAATGAALGGAAAFGVGSNLLHRRVHGTNKKPTGRTDEPKKVRDLVKKDMSTSAFGVDHGVVSKAFTGFLAAPKTVRADKLAGMAAHEKKVTGNKPQGFSLKNQQKSKSMFRGPMNTGKPRR